MATKLQNAKDEIILATMESLVPEDHLVRKLEKYIKFNFIRELAKPYYSEKGRPGYDAVIIFKIAIIKSIFGIPSIRKTCEELKVNIAYRWFLGIPFSEDIPDHSTYSKNYTNRFMGTGIYEEIFSNILEQIIENNLLDVTSINIDSTHIKARANKRKYIDKVVEKEKSIFEEEMLEFINKKRKEDDDKPLPPNNKDEYKRKKESTSDQDSGWLHKGEKEHQFAYNAHTACDNNGYVITSKLLPSNVHDTQGFGEVYQNVVEKFGDEIITVAMDAGYYSGPLIKRVCDNNHLPLLPYNRTKGKKTNKAKKYLFYDEELDVYVSEDGEVYKYINTTRPDYKVYRNDKKEDIRISIYKNYFDYVRDLRLTDFGNEKYKRSKETIERVFADFKERHGGRYTQYKGNKKVSEHILLTFACMNMKKMVNKLSKDNLLSRLYSKIKIYLLNLVRKALKKDMNLSYL